MAILATIFGLLGRFAGKLLTMSLGWASTLLFGRVPADRQVLLAAITFGAIIWAVVVFAVVWPDGGTFILALVPIPPWVEENWVRVAMLAGAIALPLGLSAATLRLLQPEDRPNGPSQLVAHLLRGYPLATGLAMMIAFLAGIGIARKVSSLLRGWTDAHIPIVAKPGRYHELARDLGRAITDGGIDVQTKPAPSVLVLPGRVLAAISGSHVRGLLPDELIRLVGRDVEVLIYPSDVAISGTKATVARVQAAIASRLTTAEAWLTASGEGQRIEDRLAEIARSSPDGEGLEAEFASVDRQLASERLPYEEWEVLYRERLQVERDLLAGVEPGEAMPVASEEGSRRQGRTENLERRMRAPAHDLLRIGKATASAVLLALGIAQLISERRGSGSGSGRDQPTAN